MTETCRGTLKGGEHLQVWIVFKTDLFLFSSIMYTRGESQRKGAGAERSSEGPNARKDCERVGGRQEDWKMSGELVLRVDGGVDD